MEVIFRCSRKHPIICPLYPYYYQLSSIIFHYFPIRFPWYSLHISSDIPQIFFKYSSHILNYPLISSNILKYSSNILKYHLTSSNILKYSSNTLKYPQIFLRYSSNIPHIFLTYPEISSDILKYPQIFLRYQVGELLHPASPRLLWTFPRSRDRHAAANAGAAGGWKATDGGGTWAVEAGFFFWLVVWNMTFIFRFIYGIILPIG
jgi:hypothetical protein